MKKKATFWQRFRYWFDNLMSQGTASLLLILGAITTVVVVTGGLAAVALGDPTEVAPNRRARPFGSRLCTPSTRASLPRRRAPYPTSLS